MRKHLKTLATAMLCLAMALLVSCKKDNVEPSGGGGTGGDTPTPTNMINGHEYVDLGLPSGLLWATCNIGADSPEDYGYYFAWGDTTTKIEYSWDTYKWCNNGHSNGLTKYCTNSDYGYNGFVDNKTVLEPEDDAANVRWGGGWRMPTLDELNELMTKCTWTWTTYGGKKGYRVTGSNGRNIFLPAAGEHNYSILNYAGYDGYYQSSSLNTGHPDYAYYLVFDSGKVGMCNFFRDYGLSVRPVSAPQN